MAELSSKGREGRINSHSQRDCQNSVRKRKGTQSLRYPASCQLMLRSWSDLMHKTTPPNLYQAFPKTRRNLELRSSDWKGLWVPLNSSRFTQTSLASNATSLSIQLKAFSVLLRRKWPRCSRECTPGSLEQRVWQLINSNWIGQFLQTQEAFLKSGDLTRQRTEISTNLDVQCADAKTAVKIYPGSFTLRRGIEAIPSILEIMADQGSYSRGRRTSWIWRDKQDLWRSGQTMQRGAWHLDRLRALSAQTRRKRREWRRRVISHESENCALQSKRRVV